MFKAYFGICFEAWYILEAHLGSEDILGDLGISFYVVVYFDDDDVSISVTVTVTG
jgi:hypothetical protein